MSEQYWFITPTCVDSFIKEKKFETIVLDRISARIAPMTTSSAFLYQGTLNMTTFKQAIQQSINYCPWIIGAIQGNFTDAMVVPRKIDAFTPPLLPDTTTTSLAGGFLICEYSNHEDKAYDPINPVITYLPQLVHEKIVRFDLAMQSIDGLPIASFKVTQFQDHFILSYRFNHVFFDRSSTIAYFHLLSKQYTGASEEVQRLSFKSRVHLVRSDDFFPNDEAFSAACPIGYTSKPIIPMDYGVPSRVVMEFSSDKINEVRGDSKVSSNDVLHAVLLQALSRYALTESSEMQAIRLLFARNMRPALGLGTEIIGDYVRMECFATTPVHIHERSILDLAKENRSLLLKMNSEELKERFKKECQWFVQYNAHGGNEGFPYCDFITDPYAIAVTNWSSFAYEEMIFGNELTSPKELLQIEIPILAETGGFVGVSFRLNENGERQLIAMLTTRHQALIEEIHQLSKQTKLFTCHVK